MKRIIFVIATMLCLFGNITTAQTIKQKVAVYVTGDAESGYKKVIGSKLVSGITRSENYAAVERTADFLAEMTKEQDYQMSGAVSDNQIAKLGQQFGVRYVVVADVSEVFESMFISARMIDVQTAQITNSTEASMVVTNMESLTKLSENIVLKLFYVTDFGKDEIKILGPFSTVRDLGSFNKPNGYHFATSDEIDKIIKNNQILNRATSLPIYTDIQCDSQTLTQYFTVKYIDAKNNVRDVESHDRIYFKSKFSCTFIEDYGKSSNLDLSYISDIGYEPDYNIWNQPVTSKYWGQITSGLVNMNTNPSITPGYVYFIKDK